MWAGAAHRIMYTIQPGRLNLLDSTNPAHHPSTQVLKDKNKKKKG